MLKTIECYEEMFATDGWKELVTDFIEKDTTLFPNLMQVKSTEQDLNVAKGRHDVFQYIVNLEKTIEGLRERLELQIQEQEQVDADAV